MPRIVATAVATPLGDLRATIASLDAGRGGPGRLPQPLLPTLLALARQALGAAKPDLVLFATTKADLDVWCESLLRAPGDYAGGPAHVAAALGAALGAPAFAVSAACASSPVACGVAARALAAGGATRVLVLAGDRLGPFVLDGFAALKALDPLGCRPFDAARAGLALGESATAVVFEADADAAAGSDADAGPEAGVHLQGWGASLDANHLTGPTRDGSGLARACAAALARAAVTAPVLVIGHGTGTRYNDDSESLAYASVCPAAPVAGYKGALGHSLGACGLVELAIATESVRRGAAPGTVGLATQGCAGAIRVLSPGRHALAHGSVLAANAGFGGINGAVVLGIAPSPTRAIAHAKLSTSIVLDHAGWKRRGADGGESSGAWTERDEAGAPRLTAKDVIGRIEPNWGRMDLACRALVALGACSATGGAGRIGPAGTAAGMLGEDTAVVLLSDVGCAASDRAFERERRASAADPQRFPYTLPTAPVGEASIRLRLRGPGFTLLGASDDQGRQVARELIADGCPRVLLARVEADGALATAWAEVWSSA